MANYRTGADLVTDVLFRGRELSSGSDFGDAVVRYLNRAFQAIWMGGSELDPEMDEVWWWLKAQEPGILNLEPLIETTVSATRGSPTVTFGSAPDPIAVSDVTDWFLKIQGDPTVYLIEEHTASSTTATLQSNYHRETSISGQACKVFKTDYDLNSFVLELTGPMRVFEGSKGVVEEIPVSTMDRDWNRDRVWTGCPEFFSSLGQGIPRVRFNRTANDEIIRVEYDYMATPNDIDNSETEPNIPFQYRKTLADAALYFLLQDKNDSRAPEALQLAISGIRAMARDNRNKWSKTGRPMLITPRAGNSSRGLRLTTSGRIF